MMNNQGPPPVGFAPPPPYYASAPPPVYAQQPQSSYYPPGPMQHGAATAPAPVIVNVAQFGPSPQRMVCPHCRANIVTYIEQDPSMTTHLAALLLCCTDWWCCAPCFYCCDCCHVKKHYCPNCNNYLGKYE